MGQCVKEMKHAQSPKLAQSVFWMNSAAALNYRHDKREKTTSTKNKVNISKIHIEIEL